MQESSKVCSLCGTALTADSLSTHNDSICTRCDRTTSHADAGQKPSRKAEGFETQVPGYELLEQLGKDDTGAHVVFKAREKRLNRLVAIRILRGQTNTRQGMGKAKRLLWEARCLALQTHPNIVRAYEVGEQDGTAFMVMEYVAGGTLAQWWRQHRPSADEAAGVVEALADALHDAHQLGLVHRGLTLDAVLMTPDGAPKISAFRAAAGDATAAADIHALGAILQVALADNSPSAEMPRDLGTICARCLQTNPEDCYRNAQELAEDLRRFRNGQPIGRPSAPGNPLLNGARNRPLRALLATLCLVACILFAVAYFNRPRPEANTAKPVEPTPTEISFGPMVLNLSAPFDQADTLFPTWNHAGKEELRLQPKPEESAFPMVVSTAACTRHAAIEAVLRHPTWNVAGPIGLVLNGGIDDTGELGYQFVIVVPEPATTLVEIVRPRLLTLTQALEQNLPAMMNIYRGNSATKLLLARKQVPASALVADPTSPPSLHLRAERDGRRLRFVCNNAEVEFEDAVPLTSAQSGAFALYLPDEVSIVSLKAWARPNETAPGLLDEADELLASRDFAEAAMKYEPFVRTHHEASYKKAVCLLEQGDVKQATAEFTLLMQRTPGPKDPVDLPTMKWQVLAMCQLWSLAIKQKNEPDAQAILDTLPRAQFLALRASVPEYLCADILGHYRWRQSGAATEKLAPRHRGIGCVQLALEMEQLFATPPSEQQRARFLVLRAASASGRKTLAYEHAQFLLKEAPAPEPVNRRWWFDFWDEYSLLLRQDGKADQALAEIERRLFTPSGLLRQDRLPLLVERACLNARLGHVPQAEADLDEFLRLARPTDFPIHFWTRACLVRGLLHEARGDLAAARKTWRTGVFKKDGKLDWSIGPGGESSVMPMIHQFLMAHLCQELSDEEVGQARDRLIGSLIGFAEARGFAAVLKTLLPEFAPEHLGPVIRKVLDSVEGRQFVRRLAHGELTYPETIEGAVVPSLVHLGKRFLEPHTVSDSEEPMLRKLVQDLYDGAVSTRISRGQFLSAGALAPLWADKEYLAVLFGLGKDFDKAAQVFEPSLRGPIAYFFGLRYAYVFRKRDPAVKYFEKALALAPTGSQLSALAAAEIAKSKKK